MRALDLLQTLPRSIPPESAASGIPSAATTPFSSPRSTSELKQPSPTADSHRSQNTTSGNLTGWSHKGYMPRIETAYAKDPARMPFDFPEVLAAIPRAVLVAPLELELRSLRCPRLRESAPIFRLLRAESALKALYPDCAHEFPDDIRKQAYDWLKTKLDSASHPRPEVPQQWDPQS